MHVLGAYCWLQEGRGNDDDPDWVGLYEFEDPRSGVASPENFTGGFPEIKNDEENKEDGKQGLDSRDGTKILPFEFVALEACLEATCTSLENDACTLSLICLLIFYDCFSACNTIYEKFRLGRLSRRLIQHWTSLHQKSVL